MSQFSQNVINLAAGILCRFNQNFPSRQNRVKHRKIEIMLKYNLLVGHNKVSNWQIVVLMKTFITFSEYFERTDSELSY